MRTIRFSLLAVAAVAVVAMLANAQTPTSARFRLKPTRSATISIPSTAKAAPSASSSAQMGAHGGRSICGVD